MIKGVIKKLKQLPKIGSTEEAVPDLLNYCQDIIKDAYQMKVFVQLSNQMTDEKKYPALVFIGENLSKLIENDI